MCTYVKQHKHCPNPNMKYYKKAKEENSKDIHRRAQISEQDIKVLLEHL